MSQTELKHVRKINYVVKVSNSIKSFVSETEERVLEGKMPNMRASNIASSDVHC